MILNPSFPDLWPVPSTPYEAEALAFCQAWQRGKATFVLQTSGSTGTPKSIILTRSQMQASAQLTANTLGLRAGDKALVCLNIRYVAGIMMLVRGLEIGMEMTIVEPSGNPLTAFDPADTHFEFMAVVPLQLQSILENTPEKVPILSGMKAILVGGAATSPALEQALQVINAPVFSTYGMTETVSHIALRRLNGPGRSDAFRALDGVVLGTDERGCLTILAAATNFELIQTNDVVELLDTDNPQRFRLLGRADTVINSGGVKVQPEQVEQIVQQTLAQQLAPQSVPRLFIAGIPDERLGQKVVLVIEQKTIPESQFETVRMAVGKALGAYAAPKQMLVVNAFAETPTGKIDRNTTMAQIR
ncbi:AMP-binding protein [Spirosoma sp. SC4-14]|uniref:AMP-binding protein n=1 Tax=Spirosoma sp. SC4-14 TaxID=3128900 RepID=UPI0030CCF145